LSKSRVEGPTQEWLERIAKQLQFLADENIKLKARLKRLER